MEKCIGFLGPGLMGKGIIKNLLKKGFPVMVYAHRDGLNLDDITQAGATVTPPSGSWGQQTPGSAYAFPLRRRSRRSSAGPTTSWTA